LKNNQIIQTENTVNWEQLLSLKDKRHKRLRIEQDDTRLGFEVDYDYFFRRL
jgi:dGTPase